MSDVVTVLQIDHHRMAGLLELIERQAGNIARREPVNYRLLESAFDYISTYPDRCHHPKEDLVYRKLIGRHPELADSLGNLVREHETLGRLTSDATRAVRESQQSSGAAIDGLSAQLLEFVNIYRRHMLMEDRHFFPAALQWLSRDEFEEIDYALFDRPDPLAGRESEARFAELRGEISRLGGAEKASSEKRDEAALLATLRDAGTFNEAMRPFELRLFRSSPHGYDLEHKGNILVHIPDCSESRAAWCAYFFWKATAREQAAR